MSEPADDPDAEIAARLRETKDLALRRKALYARELVSGESPRATELVAINKLEAQILQMESLLRLRHRHRERLAGRGGGGFLSAPPAEQDGAPPQDA